jgi:hypothetical protein
MKKRMEMRPLRKRESREKQKLEQEQQALLEQWGVTEQELKDWSEEQNEVDGREAAFEDLQNYELCLDLVGRHARESTKKTGDAIGDVRDRYETIALGFRCARGAQSREASLASGSALNALAEEFERDPKGLLRFLGVVFKRWQKIDQLTSLWRVKLVTQQHGSRDHKQIADHLETIGAAKHTDSSRSCVRQYLSRDQRNAIAKRALTTLRAAGKTGMTEPEISYNVGVSSDVLSGSLGMLQRSGQAKCKRESTDSGVIKRWFTKKKSQ